MANYSPSVNNILCLLLLSFYLLPLALFSPSVPDKHQKVAKLDENPWANLTQGAFYQHFKKKPVNEEKFFYFDESGTLIVNASKPGNSPPIMIDMKIYYPTCNTNVYFTFIFRIITNDTIMDPCKEGLTICYEGQLTGEHLRSEYKVPNLENNKAKELIGRCMKSHRNNIADIRAINVAVKNMSFDLNGIMFKWRMLSITGTFFYQTYYFKVPDDGKFILQIGDRNNLEIKLLDSDGKQLYPFLLEDTHMNKTSFGKAPDMANGARLRDHSGLWLLYLDFKTDYRTWQGISTVHPGKNDSLSDRCWMTMEIRGNRMRQCRSYYDDIAIVEPVDAKMKVVYTSESGIMRSQTYGQEDMKAISTRWKKEQLRSQATTDKTHDTGEQTQITDDVLNSISVKEKKTTTAHIWKGEHEISAHLNPENTLKEEAAEDIGQGEQGGDLDASISAGLAWENSNFESSGTRDVNQNTNIDRDKNRMFSDITKSNTMLGHFKSTHGESESLEQGSLEQSQKAFRTRESVDITVDLPPLTKVIIRQLMFDCDGNLVKMPFIKYMDDMGEELALQDNNNGTKRSAPQTQWTKKTLGEVSFKRCPRNHTVTNKADEKLSTNAIKSQTEEKMARAQKNFVKRMSDLMKRHHDKR